MQIFAFERQDRLDLNLLLDFLNYDLMAFRTQKSRVTVGNLTYLHPEGYKSKYSKFRAGRLRSN